MYTVLITGGNGLIGRYLAEKLRERGYRINVLTRNREHLKKPGFFCWNIDKREIDVSALKDVDFVIHLAGENIGEKRWTRKRKQQIIDSRTKSAELIFYTIAANNIKLKAFISASAIGYYGSTTSDNIFTETDLPADDFLGNTCYQWEEAAKMFEQLNMRTVILRTSVVLAAKNGILGKLLPIIRAGFGSAIGNGRQYLPWIHIEDLVELYIKAIEDNKMFGAFNAVAPEHITFGNFIGTVAKTLNKPLWMPKIPGFLLKLMLGEMAVMFLEGSRISSQKIMDAGYSFRFNRLEKALANLLSNI